jgi:hypothetical protein
VEQQDEGSLERVQRKDVGMVSGLQSNNYEEKLEELGLTTLQEWRHLGRHDACILNRHSKDNVQSRNWFRMVADSIVHARQETGLPNFVKPRRRLELEVRSNFFSVRTCDEWNRVPEEIRR